MDLFGKARRLRALHLWTAYPALGLWDEFWGLRVPARRVYIDPMRALVVADAPALLRPLLVAVPAGFPSPAEDFIEGQLDLNTYLVRNRLATFYVRVAGESMLPDIHPKDILVVDRSLPARDGSVVIAIVDGELVCKRLCLAAACPALTADNPKFPPIAIPSGATLEIWGVVTAVVHRVA